MPAPNPVRELIERNLLDKQLSGGAYQDRFDIGGYFSRVIDANANIGVGTDLDWEIQGTNASATTQSSELGQAVATAGADDDQAIIVPHQDTNQTPLATGINTDQEPIVEFLIRTKGNISSMKLLAGLKADLDAGVDDADLALFEYDTENSSDSGKFHALTTNSTTSDDGVTDKVAATNTLYRLRIETSTSRNCRFYINGVKKFTSDPLQAGTTLYPVLALQALEASAKTIDAIAWRLSEVLRS